MVIVHSRKLEPDSALQPGKGSNSISIPPGRCEKQPAALAGRAKRQPRSQARTPQQRLPRNLVRATAFEGSARYQTTPESP